MPTAAPDAVTRLDDRLDWSRKALLYGSREGEQLRADFLSPPFTALGQNTDDTLDTIHFRNLGSVPLSCRKTGGATVRRLEVR
jgi:hypothetical protein